MKEAPAERGVDESTRGRVARVVVPAEQSPAAILRNGCLLVPPGFPVYPLGTLYPVNGEQGRACVCTLSV